MFLPLTLTCVCATFPGRNRDFEGCITPTCNPTLCSYTDEREVYYFNVRTGESIWDHPMDSYYKALFRQEKIKLEKKRRKMVCINAAVA